LKSESAGFVQDKSKVVRAIEDALRPVEIAGAVKSGQLVVVGVIVTSVVFMLGVDSLSAVCKYRKHQQRILQH